MCALCHKPTSRGIGLRHAGLDGLRAVAIVTMIADHVLIVSGNADSALRLITRVSMPLFFLLAGHLLTRLNHGRLLIVGIVGIALGEYVEWIDAPNVLIVYAVSAYIVVAARQRGAIWLAVLAVVGFTFMANGYWHTDGYYQPLALLGIMAVGALLPRSSFPTWEIPGKRIGRYPLSVYVGHIVLLNGIA